MQELHVRRVRRAAAVVLLLALAGCGPALGGAAQDGPLSPSLSEEQVTAMAENALLAYNQGDYAAWSRDWSNTMKGAITADDFAAFRDLNLPATGQYQSIVDVEATPAQTRGFVRWVVTAEFENTPVEISFVIPETGDQIEGINFAPTGRP